MIELLLLCVTLVELLNTTTSCNIALTTSEERMALGANINSQLLLGGAGSEGVAATTNYLCFMEFWMDTCLHSIHLALSLIGSITSPLCEDLVRLDIPIGNKAEKINF